MVELISWLIAFGIVFGIPYLISKKDEQRKLDDMYRRMRNHEDDFYK